MGLNVGGFKLRYLDADADLGRAEVVEKYYRELAERAIGSAGALEEWLLDWSELDAWVEEEEAVRHVAMTCQTDDAERERRYLEFVENVDPVAKAGGNRLERKLLSSEHRGSLRGPKYAVLLRQIENSAAIFREENIPLETEDEKLRQQYQKLVGCMSIQHDGREQTLQEMETYLERTDREVRREAWEKISACWGEHHGEIDEIYDRMVEVRQRIAANAGMGDYREFAFRQLERFDYTPGDCEEFARTIRTVIAPVAEQLAAARKRQLGVESLRPWDMAVDPLGRAPLRPFKDCGELTDRCGRIFHQVSESLGQQFARMQRDDLLDLGSRRGKAPGGYMMVYPGRRAPFIFMNAVGTQKDVQTLLHEGGHAFHSFAAKGEPLSWLRDAPTEFAEVASMGMELLGGRYLDAFYPEEEAHRAREEELQNIVRFFPYMAMIDQIQHWVYTHPGHSRADRAAAWRELNERFNPWVDYSGFEGALSYAWHRKLHPFTVPFYYVEYGIAQLGALNVWLASERDYAGAVEAYRGALALGGTRPLPELFEAAGAPFDFSADGVRPVMAQVRGALSPTDY